MYIERLITNASSSSTLAFLRVLHLAHQSTSALVKDLKGIDLFKTAALRIDSADSSRVPANSDASDGPAGLANLSMIGTMLDQVFEELFMPYMEGNRYIEKETKSLNELYASYLLRFMNWHVCCSPLLSIWISFQYRCFCVANQIRYEAEQNCLR